MIILFPHQADLVIYGQLLFCPFPEKRLCSFIAFFGFLVNLHLKENKNKNLPGLDLLHLHTSNERREIFFL